MKTRNGFVSNSSSASFVINRFDVNREQLRQIVDYYDTSKELGVSIEDDWSFLINGDKIIGSTDMDNYNFRDFLQKIGVDIAKVKYYDSMSECEDEDEFTDD